MANTDIASTDLLPAPTRFVRRPEMKTVHSHSERPNGNSSTRAVYNRHIGKLVQEDDPIPRCSNDLSSLGNETIEDLLSIVSRDTLDESLMNISLRQ